MNAFTSIFIVVALEKQTVRAFGQDEALKPGMRLEADILGERRALWEWAHGIALAFHPAYVKY